MIVEYSALIVFFKLPFRLKEHSWRSGKRNVRSRKQGDRPWDIIFWTWYTHYNHKLTTSDMDEGEAPRILVFSMYFMVVNGCG